MGIFRNKKHEDCEKKLGWNFIQNALNKIYPNQEPIHHYGTLIKWRLGGNDPLDGISVYDGGDYWHFITFGLSELYEKQNFNIFASAEDNKLISGYGMEFTFKLKKDNYENEEEIKCICGILQSIARITFTKGEIFNSFEYLYTGQTQGIDTKMESNITSFITVPEKDIKSISTPNGKVNFVEFIGVTDSEIKAIQNKELSVNELYEKLGSDITSYNRASII